MEKKWLVMFFFLIIFISSVLHLPGSSLATISWMDIGGKGFEKMNEDGFGTRHNSYAWSMAWYKGKLYVGTNRDFFCYMAMLFSDTYPPNTINMECPEDPDFRAEIWCFDPQANSWTMVYQSPNVFYGNEIVARDQGYRGMTIVIEPNGKEALYIGSYLGKDLANLPARLLRTTDGQNFQEVHSTNPTVLGNNRIFSFRALTQFKNKLYLTAEMALPQKPIILESDLNIQSTDQGSVTMKFQQVNPEGLVAQEMVVFNNHLYVGTLDPIRGFSVLKTEAKGQPPYTFVPVVTDGAWRTNRDGEEAHNLNEYVLSMCPFEDHLYVGTGCGLGGYDFISKIGPAAAEIIRIDPDDTWQLVCGSPRQTPNGAKVPISSLPAGFGNPFVGYFWRMEVHNDWLYVATTDSSISLLSADLWKDKLPDREKELVEQYGEKFVDFFGGFDLWKSRNGVQWYPVTITGLGDAFNIGGRTLQSTPYGLFIGTANPFYGCQVWLGDDLAYTTRELEANPEGEMIKLSWIVPSGTEVSRILRKELFSFEEMSLGGLVEINTTTEQFYLDDDVKAGKTYLYWIKCENDEGEIVGQSNITLCRTPRTRWRFFTKTSSRMAQRNNDFSQFLNLFPSYEEFLSGLSSMSPFFQSSFFSGDKAFSTINLLQQRKLFSR